MAAKFQKGFWTRRRLLKQGTVAVVTVPVILTLHAHVARAAGSWQSQTIGGGQTGGPAARPTYAVPFSHSWREQQQRAREAQRQIMGSGISRDD